MIRILLKVLCLSIFLPLCLKAQNSILKTRVLTNQFNQSAAYLIISLEEGNLSLETITEVNFDVRLLTDSDKAHFINTQNAVYQESTRCGSHTTTVTVNSPRHITYNIVNPDGLCLQSKSTTHTPIVNRSEALVMLVVGRFILPSCGRLEIEISNPSIKSLSCSATLPSNCIDIITNNVTTYDYIIDNSDCPTLPSSLPQKANKASTTLNAEHSIYPNPTNDFFTITKANGNGMIQIFDIKGQLVYQEELIAHQKNIYTDNWQTGLYIVKIIDFATQKVEQHKLSVVKH